MAATGFRPSFSLPSSPLSPLHEVRVLWAWTAFLLSQLTYSGGGKGSSADSPPPDPFSFGNLYSSSVFRASNASHSRYPLGTPETAGSEAPLSEAVPFHLHFFPAEIVCEKCRNSSVRYGTSAIALGVCLPCLRDYLLETPSNLLRLADYLCSGTLTRQISLFLLISAPATRRKDKACPVFLVCPVVMDKPGETELLVPPFSVQARTFG